MRPSIFHDLSRHLAIRLEQGIRDEEGGSSLPVYLCHPLDLSEIGSDETGDGPSGGHGSRPGTAAAALYLARIVPDPRYRRGGHTVEREPAPVDAARLRRRPLWVRLRYVFMVAGGSHEEELGALARALQTLDGMALLPLDALGGEDGFPAADLDALPLEIVADHEAWRELGLGEHRLGISFEVALPLESRDVRALGRIVEREVRVERSAEGERERSERT